MKILFEFIAQARLAFLEQQFGGSLVQSLESTPTFHPTNSHAMSVPHFETQETHARELKQVRNSLSCTTVSLRVRHLCQKDIKTISSYGIR